MKQGWVEKSKAERTRQRDALTEVEKQQVAKVLSGQLLSVTGGRALNYEPSSSMGAKDSAHDVFFVGTGGGRRSHGQTFACKRFRRPESASQELAGLAEARNRGLKTLDPVEQGIYPVDGVGHIFVTSRVPRFTTMNYLGWRDFYAGQPDYDRRIAGPLRRIGDFVGSMHARGVVHGDLQVKNIAQNYKGEFILFDLEDVTFFDEHSDSFQRAGKYANDLGDLATSLVARGFLWDATDKSFRDELTENLFTPYLEACGDVDEVLIDYIDKVIGDANAQRYELHNDFSSRIGLPS